jgi:hypothetical protein
VITAGLVPLTVGLAPVAFGASVAEAAPLGAAATKNVAPAAADPPHLYVANLNSVTEYDENVDGNVAPLATISGPSTGIDRPGGVAADKSGNVFISNTDSDLPGGERNPSVTGYPTGATGDRAPTTTIQGSNTVLTAPGHMNIDLAQNLFVVNDVSVTQDSVNEYAQAGTGNATGNVTPKASISGPNTGLNFPTGVAVDSGGDVFVANYNDAITEYAPGATGNQAPKATISGPNTGLDTPIAVAVDSGGNVFVANYKSSTVTEYGKGANGNQAPVATIGGPHTGIMGPVAIAVDAQENLFLSNLSGDAVYEYPPGANGDQAPKATIKGDKTGLDAADSLAVPPIPSDTPPTTTPDAPKVGQASPGDNSGSIAFTPPANNGRLPLVSYTASAADLDNPSGTRTATGTGSPITVPNLTNGDLYSFSVSAANILGSGPYSDGSNQVRVQVSSGVQGDGSNDHPFTAECDDPGPTDCVVSSFPPRYLDGLHNEYAPAYQCPSNHPYLLNQGYAPFGTHLPNGVENVETESPWPIGISISGRSSAPRHYNGHDYDVITGTLTGDLNSSVTNYNTNKKSYKVVLHCTQDITHGYARDNQPIL